MPIPRFLTAELAGHIDGKRPDDLVFAGIRNGQPLRVSTSVPRSARRRGRSACPTCTRTSCGTPRPALAIASGADVKVVQQMLGHSSATMTLDTYGHLFEDRLDEVGDALDRAREAARQRRELLPRVAPVLSETDFLFHIGVSRCGRGGGAVDEALIVRWPLEERWFEVGRNVRHVQVGEWAIRARAGRERGALLGGLSLGWVGVAVGGRSCWAHTRPARCRWVVGVDRDRRALAIGEFRRRGMVDRRGVACGRCEGVLWTAGHLTAAVRVDTWRRRARRRRSSGRRWRSWWNGYSVATASCGTSRVGEQSRRLRGGKVEWHGRVAWSRVRSNPVNLGHGLGLVEVWCRCARHERGTSSNSSGRRIAPAAVDRLHTVRRWCECERGRDGGVLAAQLAMPPARRALSSAAVREVSCCSVKQWKRGGMEEREGRRRKEKESDKREKGEKEGRKRKKKEKKKKKKIHGNGEAAPTSVSAGQGRFSGSYPRPDSNRRYRLERGIEGSSDDVENQ